MCIRDRTWVLQGRQMHIPTEAWWWPTWLVKDAAQMQALNPLLIMLLIPVSYTHLDVYKRQAGWRR